MQAASITAPAKVPSETGPEVAAARDRSDRRCLTPPHGPDPGVTRLNRRGHRVAVRGESGAREIDNVTVFAVAVPMHMIVPASRERLFEPFYTTKPNGQGMGLSICRSIIEAHGGRLWVEANEPRGAIFLFSMPARRALA